MTDWRLALSAANKAPRTIDAYPEAGEKLARHTGDVPVSTIGHREIRHYLVDLAETPHQRTGKRVTDSYVAGHYRRLQQLFRWLVEEDEITDSPFRRLRAPAIPEVPVAVLTESDMTALLSTKDKRGQAMLRVLLDTGVRVSDPIPRVGGESILV